MRKQLKDKSILYVYNFDHPIHRRLMSGITNHFIHKSKPIPKDYDVYVFEGEYANAVFQKYRNLIGKNRKIISFIADPRLYYLCEDKIFDVKKNLVKKYPSWRKILLKNMIGKLDGVICMGKLTYDYLKQINRKNSAIWVEGFVSNEIFRKLLNSNPEFKEPSLLFIGHGPDYYCKGIDRMIDSFKLVKKKIPNAKLFVLGSGWKVKDAWKVDGIYFEGKQNIIPYVKKCSLGIHLGRGEAFGANIPEMMLAGLPVLVSDKTGAKEVVKKFDSNFVSELHKEKIARKIISYFELSLVKKKNLGKKAKIVAKDYAEKKQTSEFKKRFNGLMEEIF